MYIQKIHIFIVVLMAKTFESIVKIVVFNIADVKPLQIIAKTMFCLRFLIENHSREVRQLLIFICLMSKPIPGIIKTVNFYDLRGFWYIEYISIHAYPNLYKSLKLTILTIPCNGLELKIIKINNFNNSL